MWFIIATLAFLLLALASVIDKFLLTKTKIVPVSFAFYIAAFAGVFGSLLIFFDHSFYLPYDLLGVLVLGGSTLFFGLYFMFLAVERAEVSKTSPIIVSLTPVSVFFLSLLLGLELVSFYKIIGIVIVIVAGYWLSQVGQAKNRLNAVTWLLVVLASALMGASNVYSKIAYDHLSFISAFVWLRWTCLAAALLYVSFSFQWHKILLKEKSDKKTSPAKSAVKIMIIGQVAGSLGVVLLQLAIKLGNVILVTALNGLQFFFVIYLVYLLSRFYPNILKEDIKRRYVWQKVVLSAVMVVGVVLVLI